MSGFSPVIILGAARSGTTLLAEQILARHPDVHYWNEPAFIWRAGFSYRSDDLIGVDELSQGHKAFVRNAFLRRLEAAGEDLRLVEKTPANCLRVESILEIFPGAQFIHVIRDGRAVALSAAMEWQGLAGDALDSPVVRSKSGASRIIEMFREESDLRARLRNWRTVLDLPAYLWRFVLAVYRQAAKPDWLPWGPRIPGLRQIRRSCPLLETCAIQWETCVRMAMASGRALGASRYMEVRYEDLLADPQREIANIVEFLGLAPFSAESLRGLANAVQDRTDAWRARYTEETLFAVERRIGPALQELGYCLESQAPPMPVVDSRGTR